MPNKSLSYFSKRGGASWLFIFLSVRTSTERRPLQLHQRLLVRILHNIGRITKRRNQFPQRPLPHSIRFVCRRASSLCCSSRVNACSDSISPNGSDCRLYRSNAAMPHCAWGRLDSQRFNAITSCILCTMKAQGVQALKKSQFCGNIEAEITRKLAAAIALSAPVPLPAHTLAVTPPEPTSAAAVRQGGNLAWLYRPIQGR